jgi:hypothetical protein
MRFPRHCDLAQDNPSSPEFQLIKLPVAGSLFSVFCFLFFLGGYARKAGKGLEGPEAMVGLLRLLQAGHSWRQGS